MIFTIITIFASAGRNAYLVAATPQYFMQDEPPSFPWNYNNRYGQIQPSLSLRPHNENSFYPTIQPSTGNNFPNQQPSIFQLQTQPSPQPLNPPSWTQYPAASSPPPQMNPEMLTTLFLQPLLAIDSQVFALYQLIKCFERQGDLKKCVRLIEEADRLFDKKKKGKKRSGNKNKKGGKGNKKRGQNKRQKDNKKTRNSDEEDDDESDDENKDDYDDEGNEDEDEDDDQEY